MNADTIQKLCQTTGLVYCDEDCPCGENSRLVHWTEDAPSWIPDWANAVAPEELYSWMLKVRDSNANVQQALLEIGAINA